MVFETSHILPSKKELQVFASPQIRTVFGMLPSDLKEVQGRGCEEHYHSNMEDGNLRSTQMVVFSDILFVQCVWGLLYNMYEYDDL